MKEIRAKSLEEAIVLLHQEIQKKSETRVCVIVEVWGVKVKICT